MKKRNILLQASTILFMLNISASALNYLCQLVMARTLSVESYGTINTIFSFMMIIAVPGTTLTMIVAKYYAGNAFDRVGYLKKQLQVVLVLTVAVFVILVVARNQLCRVLKINDGFVVSMAIILAALGYFQPLFSGVFSGNKLFVLVGIYSLFIPLCKMVAIGGACIYSNVDKTRLYIVLIIMVIGTLTTAAYGHNKSKRIIGIEHAEKVIGEKLYKRDDINALILNLSLMLYMNIDLLAVRYYGSDTESGLYSSVLLFGRIIYYFATTLGTILLPSVASNVSDEIRKKTLNKTLILMIVFALVCMLPINIFKEFFIRVLYGVNYISAASYMIYVSIISLSLSIYTIMVNYVVGVGRTKLTTRIMVIVDLVLLYVVWLVHDVNLLLMLIGLIGMGGTIAIYIGCFRKHAEKA